MIDGNTDWEYCQIRFQLRYKGEDFSRSGSKQMWLVFQAKVSGPNGEYHAGESAEIPVAGNVMGGAMSPQKNDPSHQNIHQDFVKQLRVDGWELLAEQREPWWAWRFRRIPNRSKREKGR